MLSHYDLIIITLDKKNWYAVPVPFLNHTCHTISSPLSLNTVYYFISPRIPQRLQSELIIASSCAKNKSLPVDSCATVMFCFSKKGNEWIIMSQMCEQSY